MARVNKFGYIERITSSNNCGRSKSSATWRNWWFVKCSSTNRGSIDIGKVILPKEYIGERIRIKIEVIE